MISIAQEPLGLRRESFPLSSRYLYRHSLFFAVHRWSPIDFNPQGMLPYRALHFHLRILRINSTLGFHKSLDLFLRDLVRPRFHRGHKLNLTPV
jgi:hypothetical protein